MSWTLKEGCQLIQVTHLIVKGINLVYSVQCHIMIHFINNLHSFTPTAK